MPVKVAFFFTYTSSVPIGLLDKEVGLGGRILGVHFYNPPPVQKLVETIRGATTRDDVAQTAADIGKRLRKTLIPSADVAGFIGNGHFIRDGHHVIAEVEKLADKHGWPSAVWMMNRVSQDWLLRPMGIFQLIDCVGVDVFQFIEGVMDHYLDEKLTNATINTMMERKAAGGQRPDGSQKPGFFEYERGKITGVYDPGDAGLPAARSQGLDRRRRTRRWVSSRNRSVRGRLGTTRSASTRNAPTASLLIWEETTRPSFRRFSAPPDRIPRRLCASASARFGCIPVRIPDALTPA